MYALPVSIPPSRKVLTPMTRSIGSSFRYRPLATPRMRPRMRSSEPIVARLSLTESRTVRSPASRIFAYRATASGSALRSATVVRPAAL
jgi:hypothetical protein